MAYVNIIDIQLVGPNPSLWTDNFRFQIDFESVAELKDGKSCISRFVLITIDLEWKILYVGSAENEENDQVLTSVLVGPIPVGRNRFELEVSYIYNSKFEDPCGHLQINIRDAVRSTS